MLFSQHFLLLRDSTICLVIKPITWTIGSTFFAVVFNDTIHTRLQKKDRTPKQNGMSPSENAGTAEKLNDYETRYCPIEKRPCRGMQGRLFHAF